VNDNTRNKTVAPRRSPAVHQSNVVHAEPAASPLLTRSVLDESSSLALSTVDLSRLQRTIGNQAFVRAIVAPARAPAQGGHVQRHASWEHRMLGDMKPSDLATLGTARNTAGGVAIPVPGEDPIEGDKTAVVHVLEQEIRRLLHFKNSPPTAGDADAFKATTIKVDDADPAWQVRLVKIPSLKVDGSPRDGVGPEVVSYGELNTLADFYGSVEEMKATDPANRHLIILGIREDSLRKMMSLYKEVLARPDTQGALAAQAPVMVGVGMALGQGPSADGGKAESASHLAEMQTEVASSPDGMDFFDASHVKASPVGSAGAEVFHFGGPRAVASVLGSGEQFGDRDKRAKKPLAPDDATTSYGATLARNACHFAPESWHAWAGFHKQAVLEAKLAAAKRGEAARLRVLATQQLYEAGNPFNSPLETAASTLQAKTHGASADKADAEAALHANEALLQNGFGDHYLQDSYAAGHLINKTKIMQWYVEFIDKASWLKEKTLHKDEEWRGVQAMAYEQPGLSADKQYDKADVGKDRQIGGQAVTSARNPQSVENVHVGPAGQAEPAEAWRIRFEALGLATPTAINNPSSLEFQFLVWWQLHCAQGGKKKHDFVDLKKLFLAHSRQGSSDDELIAVVQKLVDQGMVHRDWSTSTPSKERTERTGPTARTAKTKDTFVLRDAWVPRDAAVFKKLVDRMSGASFEEDPFDALAHRGLPERVVREHRAAAVTESRATAAKEYQAKGAEVVYADYILFMKDAMVQKATNALHDLFCASGLMVSSTADGPLFKIYGDEAMLQAESQRGLLHSATTARMSRDAIDQALGGDGAADPAITTASIVDRFPAHVQVPTMAKGKVTGSYGAAQGIGTFHADGGALKALCTSEVFPNMSSGTKGAMATKDLSTAVSKDEAVIHGGAPF
jgi:hypothetical protein